MTTTLKGKPVADAIKESLRKEISEKTGQGKTPTLAILRAGERKDDIAYEEKVIRNCIEIGMKCKVFSFPETVLEETFLESLKSLNEDPDIHGILIFRPLPPQINTEKVRKRIRPDKDVDGMSGENEAKLFEGNSQALAPCTAIAVVEILKYYRFQLEGSSVAIVNRSLVLGKPLAMLLLNENATVTICHSKTKELETITRAADVVVTGVGKAGFFTEKQFAEHSTIIDVGINFDEKGLCGDVARDVGEGYVAAISPVPGGVGTVTSMILLRNVLHAMKLQTENNVEKH